MFCNVRILCSRSWLLVSAQVGLHQEYISELVDIAALHSDFLLLETCGDGSSFYERCRGQRTFSYPDVLQVPGHFTLAIVCCYQSVKRSCCSNTHMHEP